MLLRRLLLAVTAAGIIAGLTVLAAGAARVGPLADLGWTEQILTPQAVLARQPAAQAIELEVGFDWNRSAFCYEEFTVTFSESSEQVVVRSVSSRVPRFSFLPTRCARQDTRGGRAYARIRLTGPLLQRPVLSGTGRRLAVEPG